MEFAFTQEQDELRRQARSFLESNADAPLTALRELGWLGVSVPEERGGGGLSFVDEALLFEEVKQSAEVKHTAEVKHASLDSLAKGP